MYQHFIDAFPVFLSLYQSGFYQLFSTTTILPYQNAWLEVKLPNPPKE